jgi:LysR family cyn operon transcriptional activator
MKFHDQLIRSFIKIAELKSLTSAAEMLDLSQSGLSKQLHQLEEYLGQSLFHRTGRGVSLTAAGEKLYAAASSAFSALDYTLAQLRTTEGITEGALRIATVHTLNTYFMPDLFSAFLTQRPNINVSLLSRSSPEVVELLEAGKVDVGFVYDVAVASDNVLIHPLFNEEMVLIHGSGEFSMDAELDLTKMTLPLVCFPAHYALRRMLHHAQIHYNVVAEVETVDAMLKLVKSGLGSCILPDRIPKDLVEANGLMRSRIVAPVLQRRVVGILRKDRPISELMNLLLGIARAQATPAAS